MGVMFGDLICKATPQCAIDGWGDAKVDDRAQMLNAEGVKAIPVVTSSTPPPVPAPPAGRCACACRQLCCKS